jgi:hypothetical protein
MDPVTARRVPSKWKGTRKGELYELTIRKWVAGMMIMS